MNTLSTAKPSKVVPGLSPMYSKLLFIELALLGSLSAKAAGSGYM